MAFALGIMSIYDITATPGCLRSAAAPVSTENTEDSWDRKRQEVMVFDSQSVSELIWPCMRSVVKCYHSIQHSSLETQKYQSPNPIRPFR